MSAEENQAIVRRYIEEAVGNGNPGPLTGQLREAYWELHDDPRFSLPVHYD